MKLKAVKRNEVKYLFLIACLSIEALRIKALFELLFRPRRKERVPKTWAKQRPKNSGMKFNS